MTMRSMMREIIKAAPGWTSSVSIIAKCTSPSIQPAAVSRWM